MPVEFDYIGWWRKGRLRNKKEEKEADFQAFSVISFSRSLLTYLGCIRA